MKKRILVSQIVTLVLLVAARPDSWPLFWAGLLLMALGQCVRLAASAAITKYKTLTTAGPYSAVRNPLYLGTMIMTAGLLTMLTSPSRPLPSAFVWLFGVASFGWIYYVTIKSEEVFLETTFGDDFRKYAASVPALLPTLSGLAGFFETSAYSREVFRKNKEWRGFTASVVLTLLVAARIHYGF